MRSIFKLKCSDEYMKIAAHRNGGVMVILKHIERHLIKMHPGFYFVQIAHILRKILIKT